MIICAGESEQFDFALPVGIGLTDVAINLTRLCLSQKPKFLLFVGTAGSYGKKKVFDIVESKTAANIENSFFTGGSYTPIDNMVSTAEDVSRETIVNSSNYITTDKSIGKAYLSKNIHLENMEYYAVLKVAKSFDIPAAGIFIVTNYCDENAHRDFMDNHKEAMLRLTQYIKESK
ncbi:purine-nucleoside phosphorylase [Sulfurovum sp. XGS-02]|uniref:phosphorylase family protein n=1 Tax=Sulfurovum sp. XGS-02 TaxID=2925411 RepID=UPI002050222A|nr:purine-nucleoside phosphorylase [Sulfurovum sp. XGS-02]UPT77533.1 purine-nucleoside phosphorylase [Sulfurovum sp. XGS-02]